MSMSTMVTSPRQPITTEVTSLEERAQTQLSDLQDSTLAAVLCLSLRIPTQLLVAWLIVEDTAMPVPQAEPAPSIPPAEFAEEKTQHLSSMLLPWASVGVLVQYLQPSLPSCSLPLCMTSVLITMNSILVIGAKNSGKTSFLRFLRQSLALKKRGQAIPEEASAPPVITAQGEFTGSYTETEIDGERIGLTLWDSAGLEKNVVDLQIRELVAFVEAKFEETFAEENKVVRAPGIRDTHIHCVFLLLDPARLTPNNHYFGKTGSNATELGGLDQGLDISVFKALRGKTVVVPVISKADTCTSKHMEHLKEIVRSGLAKAGEDPLVSLDLEIEGEGNDDERDTRSASPRRGKRSSLPEVEEDEDDDDEKLEDGETDKPKPPPKELPITPGLTFIPLTIISPDSYEPGEKVGRAFPWGFADPYDENHCDFKRLKYSVFSEWRAELREKSRESWYEHWRSERLGSTGGRRRRV